MITAHAVPATPATTLVVIAKEPLAGKAKTRLHPPLTLEQAAEVAAAAIDDTLDAVAALPAADRILLYDGEIVPTSASAYRVVPQVDGALDRRLGAIFDYCTGPTLLIGMDTPQVSFDDLAPAFENWPDDVDAWFGPASDGGFWALGLREPDGDLLRGVPMSRDDTGHTLLFRLRAAGLRVAMLPTLTDVDDYVAAVGVGALIPNSRFSAVLNDAAVPNDAAVRATSLIGATS